MVGVMIGLLYVQFWIMGGDFNKFPVEITPDFVGDNRMTVFGRIYDVVITEVYAMT